jgi:LmbE family N-acetylglucosaminyl deacetylase
VLVSFHAHPDDEALLCGGTLARAAADGHRVVLVVATSGEAGLTAGGVHGEELARRREAELEASANALGVARTVVLGYADSGMHGECGGDEAFGRAPVEAAARRLADVLEEERADVLTVYDPAGGYGHPDHRAVHVVGVRAAELAGTPVVLEATVEREAISRVVRVLRRLPRMPSGLAEQDFGAAFTPRAQITHRVDVRRHLDAKRAALAAHASQQSGDPGTRTVALLLRLPRPLQRAALGREWFVERGRPAGPSVDDVFASLRSRPVAVGGAPR